MPFNEEDIDTVADVIAKVIKATMQPFEQRIAAVEKELRHAKTIEILQAKLQKAVD